MDLILVESLVDDLDTPYDNKLARAMAFYACWKYENIKKQALKEETLIACQQSWYRELGFIVFGFWLYNT